jgi:hypothetical protein
VGAEAAVRRCERRADVERHAHLLRGGLEHAQNTYTDSTGSVANSNPITLNTRGETPNEVWLTGGQTYKLVLKDSAGAIVWTVDNLTGVNVNRDRTCRSIPSRWPATRRAPSRQAGD